MAKATPSWPEAAQLGAHGWSAIRTVRTASDAIGFIRKICIDPTANRTPQLATDLTIVNISLLPPSRASIKGSALCNSALCPRSSPGEAQLGADDPAGGWSAPASTDRAP